MVTPTQQKIIQFIQNYIRDNGLSPTLIEIAQGIGIRSKSLISRYVHALVEQGEIELGEGGTRRIRVKQPANTLKLIGRIAAGEPIEAITQEESIILTDLLGGEDRYALQVKGNSMIDEGILDGDIVVCEKRHSARNGDIVVALIDQNEATLKKFKHDKEKGVVTLIPANPTLKPMTYSARRVRIQGIFVGLLRLQLGSQRWSVSVRAK